MEILGGVNEFAEQRLAAINAMEEAEIIAQDSNRKRYSSFSEILDEVKGEMANE